MAPYRFAYDPPALRGGLGTVTALGDELDRLDGSRAMLVCGANVGDNDAAMDPVRDGLGDRLIVEFDETTPEKRLGTAIRGHAMAREAEVDTLVAVGGGSSLDIAKVIAALHAVERPATTGAEVQERGTFSIPAGEIPSIVVLPTTLAGADLSRVAGLTAAPETCPVDEPASGGIGDDRLMPALVAYDPDILATTPIDVLTGSAMNGLDKGIETLYAANRTPITDATAAEGLARLAPALRALRERPTDRELLARILEGICLVQYGTSRSDANTLSLIHAYGHAVARDRDLQQGIAHAVLAPHVLAYIFDRADTGRGRLARALGVPLGADTATAIVDEVAEIRDALGLPARLGDVADLDPEEFTDVADAVLADSLMAHLPPGLDPSRDDLVGILEAAH